MSASQVVGVVAGVVVGYFFGPQAGFATYAAVSGIGAYLTAPDIEGPRLEELRVQNASYGNPIPFEWGANRHAGTIIWPKEMALTEHSESESAKGGPEQVTYTYTCNAAVLICEGEIAGIRRIWANKKIIYDVSAGNTGLTIDPSIGAIRFYLGTDSQTVDPLIEALDGDSPAYLGYAYVVFEDFVVTDYGNRPPQWEFEVISTGEEIFDPELTLLDEVPAQTKGAKGYSAALDTTTGRLWVHNGTSGSVVATTGGSIDGSCVNVYNVAARTRTSIISLGEVNVGDLVYSEYRLKVFGGGEYVQDEAAFIFDPADETLESTIPFTLHTSDTSWVERPGTLVPYDSGYFLAASSSSHVGTGIVLWNPEVGVFSETDDLEGWWKDQGIPLVGDGYRAALITSTGIIVLSDLWAYDFYPSDDFGGTDPTYIAEDTTRELILVAAGLTLWTLNYATGVVTQIYATGAPGFTVRCMKYDVRADLYYVVTAAAGQHFLLMDPETLEVTNTVSLVGMAEFPLEIIISPVAREVVLIGLTEVWLLSGLYASLEPGQVALSTIVTDICVRAGLTEGDINVTQLTDMVDGYIVPRQMSARAALQPLMAAYFFDAVESDDKIKFVKRGGAVEATILEEDRAAYEHGQDVPDALSMTRAFEMELPYQCEVEYPDVDADHLIGAQYDRRLTKGTRHQINLRLPIVMTAEKAKQIARIALYEAWLNQTFRWTTTRKYAYLEPTSPVLLPTSSATYRCKITGKRENPNGVIEWEGQITDVDIYTMTGAGAVTIASTPQSIYDPGTTEMALLDMPILRDEDDDAGFYIGLGGASATWPGATLYKSMDSGATYSPMFAATNEAAIAIAQTVLGDFAEGNIFDEGSTVTIMMTTGLTLSSATEDQVLNGSNMAVIGAHGRWEVIQFKTATLIAPGMYTLSGFLRGRHGTEWAIDTHEVLDTIVLASTSNWNRANSGDTGLVRKYKAPPFNTSLSVASATDFTNSSVGLKPFAPVNVVASRNGSNNLTLSWARRTRLATGTLHLAVPLGEATESYSIDIVLAEMVVRTISASTATASYSAANQTADGITPGNPINVRIYQISATVGRGYPLEQTV